MKWLIESANFGLFSFNDLTRAISWGIEIPYKFVLSLIAKGFYLGQGSQAVLILSPISWIAIVISMTIIAVKLKDIKLAFLHFFLSFI